MKHPQLPAIVLGISCVALILSQLWQAHLADELRAENARLRAGAQALIDADARLKSSDATLKSRLAELESADKELKAGDAALRAGDAALLEAANKLRSTCLGWK